MSRKSPGVYKPIHEVKVGDKFELYDLKDDRLKEYIVDAVIRETSRSITFKVTTEGGDRQQSFLKRTSVKVVPRETLENDGRGCVMGYQKPTLYGGLSID